MFNGRGKIKNILKMQGQDQQFSLFNIVIMSSLPHTTPCHQNSPYPFPIHPSNSQRLK
jgi:hypothetical protein